MPDVWDWCPKCAGIRKNWWRKCAHCDGFGKVKTNASTT